MELNRLRLINRSSIYLGVWWVKHKSFLYYGFDWLRMQALYNFGVDGLSLKASSTMALDWLGTKALYNLGVDGLRIISAWRADFGICEHNYKIVWIISKVQSNVTFFSARSSVFSSFFRALVKTVGIIF